jgi:hypothetical protein
MENEKFDVVLIVGNGFDLNLELNTGYSNFIKSVHFDSLILDENQLAKHLSEQNNLNNWIDIENELKIYSKNNPENTDFIKEFKNLSNSLLEYLRTINYYDLDRNKEAYKLIEKISNYEVLIIDFNYTSTIEHIFNRLNIDTKNPNIKIKHVKIHGSVNDKNIIFGIEDSSSISPKHVFLKKSTHKNFDSNNYNPILKECQIVMVFGHSLGETDHTYFHEFFFNAVSNSYTRTKQNIRIHHYGEQGYYELFSQIDSLTIKQISKLKQLNDFKMIDTKVEN